METSTAHGFSIPIQLTRVQSDADFHTLDVFDRDGQPLPNRENITDDSTAGFLIQISLEKAIHKQGSDPASFIGMKFRFDGINERRRFRHVEITIRFENSDESLGVGPVVEDLWPDRNYTLSPMETPVNIQTTTGVDSELGGGGGGGINVAGKAQWQRMTTFTKTDQAALVGAKVYSEKKNSGPKDAVSLKLYENATAGSGVLKELKAGILLRRKGCNRFRAIFSINATADMRYAIATGRCRLFGKAHVTDPVTFDPMENYHGPHGPVVTQGTPDQAMVKAFGEAVSATLLQTVREA